MVFPVNENTQQINLLFTDITDHTNALRWKKKEIIDGGMVKNTN